MSDISKEREEPLVLLVLRGRLAQKVQREIQEQEETVDLRVPLDLLAQPDHPDLLGPQEMGSTFDGADFRDQMKRVQAPSPGVLSSNLRLCLETPVSVAPEDSAAYRAFPVNRVKKDHKETLDCLDPLVIKAAAVARE